MYYVYVLKSHEDFYLGYTRDLERRLEEHNCGDNKSTQGRKWQLVYYEAYVSERFAMKRESSLKRNRRMKQFLLSRIKESVEY